jgi:hypothetical protein
MPVNNTAIWRRAEPYCVMAHRGHPGLVRLAVRDETGAVQRFVLSDAGFAWLLQAAVSVWFPRIAALLRWLMRDQLRDAYQSEMSSGIPSFDGSPKEGQAQ